MPVAPRQRATEALALVAAQYDLRADLEALERAGDDWQPLALAMACEAIAALLLDVRPRPGSRMRERRKRGQAAVANAASPSARPRDRARGHVAKRGGRQRSSLTAGRC